jgi:hypothetical protein
MAETEKKRPRLWLCRGPDLHWQGSLRTWHKQRQAWQRQRVWGDDHDAIIAIARTMYPDVEVAYPSPTPEDLHVKTDDQVEAELAAMLKMSPPVGVTYTGTYSTDALPAPRRTQRDS